MHSLQFQGHIKATIKVYAAAISECHEWMQGAAVFSDPLFCDGKGCFSERVTVPQCDLSVVLNSLCAVPFELLEEVSVRLLALKAGIGIQFKDGDFKGFTSSASCICRGWQIEPSLSSEGFDQKRALCINTNSWITCLL